MKKIAIFVMLFCFCIALGVAQEDRLQQLEKKILEQRKILNELEQQVNDKEKQTREYTEQVIAEYSQQAAASEMPVSAGYDKGFFIKTADNMFKIKFNGYLKHVLYFAESGAVQNNTYSVQQNRLDFNIYYDYDWHARVRIDIGDNSNLTIREAYLEYTAYPCFQPRIGGFLVPFNMEALTSPTDLITIFTPAYLTSLPVRDVGIQIAGDFAEGYMSYAIAMLNGEGETRLNTDDEFMFMGQLKFYPMTKKNDFFVQLSAFIHNAEQRNDGARLALPAVQGHEVFGRDLPGPDPNDVDSTAGRQVAFDAALRYRIDGLRFESEFVWARFDRDRFTPSRNSLDLFGVMGAVSYFVELGEKDSGMGVEPVFRMAYTRIDDRQGDGSGTGVSPLGSASDVHAQEIWEFVMGAKFHFNRHFRADFNWVIYDLGETGSGLTNDVNGGGSTIHAWLFQFVAQW